MAEARLAAAEASPQPAFDDWSSSDEVAEEPTNKEEDLGPTKEVASLQMALAAVAGSLVRGAAAMEGGSLKLGEEFLCAVRALRDRCNELLELGERTRCGQERSETSSTGADTEEDFALSADEDELPFSPRSSAVAREAAASEEAAGPLAKGGAHQPAATFATAAPKTGPALLVVPPLDLARFAGSGAAVGAQQDEAASFQFAFCVSCACTRMGQQVRIVGSCPALGAWDPLAGLLLHTSAAEFPIWRGRRAVTLEAESVVEYKYVICDAECNVVQWEEKENRRLHVASAAAMAGSRSRRDGNGGEELTPPRVLVAEVFNELGGPAARFRSASLPGLDLDVALCTPRRPLQAAPLFTPTMRRHLRTALLEEAEAPPGAAGLEAAPSVLVLPAAAALAAAAAAPRLAREDSFSLLFARPAEETTRAPRQDFEDSYELLGDGPLGEGTFGLVWRCRPRAATQQEEWAVKILHTCPGGPRRHVLSPLEEVRLHSSLQHPHVLFLLEYFEEAGVVTAVLEYCRGGDLFDAIQAEASRPGGSGGGLGEPGAAAMAGHILAALGYLHGRSVVHRDLKCENVLLAHAGVPHAENDFKLGDFGFAAVDSGVGLCEQLGSPDTVAPEVVQGKTYTCSADLWSMGVVLYMALAAESPFRARTDGKVLQRVIRGEYSLCGGVWDTISEPAKDLVAALLTLQPPLRPPAARALRCAWLR